MATANLLIALALVAGGWLAIVRVLGRSAAESPDAMPAVVPANRLRLTFPVQTGPVNPASTVAAGRRKDLA